MTKEEIAKWYQEDPDRLWGDVHIKILLFHIKILEEACEAAIPCLEDWIITTGFGMVNRRDKNALELIKRALSINVRRLWFKHYVSRRLIGR